MKIVCVIPARYASTRLPGKPLRLIGGVPMIVWVVRRAGLAGIFDKVIVATDDERIAQTVRDAGGEAMMTAPELPSGTDRVAKVAESTAGDVFINLQGDEPLIDPQVLRSVAAAFDDPDVQMATPVKKVVTPEELEDPSLVRVAIDKKGDAMYFTRSVIPFLRDEPDRKHWMHKYPFYRHIGIYAYRKNFLLGLAQLPAGELEQAEKLEQLRVLENGYKIRTVLTGFAGMSVDTEMDLTEINRYVRENNLTADGKL